MIKINDRVTLTADPDGPTGTVTHVNGRYCVQWDDAAPDDLPELRMIHELTVVPPGTASAE